MWKRLTHPNILPLLGVTVDPPQLISSWMSSGDLCEYIRKNPDADRPGLVSAPLLRLPLTYPFPAIRCRSRPLLPPLLQHHSWRSPGSTWLFRILFRHYIDTGPAKHPRGRLRLCTHRGFWPSKGRSKPRFRAKRITSTRPHRTMDCAGDPEGGDIQQGS